MCSGRPSETGVRDQRSEIRSQRTRWVPSVSGRGSGSVRFRSGFGVPGTGLVRSQDPEPRTRNPEPRTPKPGSRTATNATRPPKPKHSAMKRWTRILLGISLFLAVGITLAFICTIPFVRIEGPSMEPALSHGDLVCVLKRRPEEHQIAVIKRSSELTIKRVLAYGPNIAVEWSTIKESPSLYPLNAYACAQESEPETPAAWGYRLGQMGHPKGVVPPLTEIPAKHAYLLGDNRLYSEDSRQWGPVPESDIVGTVWFKWPF